jgi:phosphoserine phosphatase RsbU/P
MLSRHMPKLWIALLAVLVVCPTRSQAQANPAPVRYHFGDDPDGKLGWADPNFDDRGWPVAANGRWPMPPFYSDGFIWLRFRIPVRSDASGSLAARSSREPFVGAAPFTVADELYVDGALAGREGYLPPHAELHLPQDFVFDLSGDEATPGKTAVVAIRVWCPPVLRYSINSGAFQIAIDESRNLQLAQRADHESELYANGLNLALNVGIGILGVGMLLAWRWTGERDLLVFSWVMIPQAFFLLAWSPLSPGVGRLPFRSWIVVSLACCALFLVALVELNWTVHRLRAPFLKRLGQAGAVVFVLSILIPGLSTNPAAVAHWAMQATFPAEVAFQGVLVAVNVWAIVVRRTNPLLVLALVASPAVELLFIAGLLPFGVKLGPFYEHPVALADFLGDVAIFALLIQRAWKEWRARDELRVEFEAAREVQERLVAPAVDLPGFKITSVYVPAKQVGGDFFRVLPEPDGSVLVVVGDVSGKGLKAAMTVSAIIGALRTMPALPPTRILAALNRGLVGQMQGGFVTCCVARIGLDGAVTIANAGHLSPYLNGAEFRVGAGLPLGIDAIADYEESDFQLKPDEPLTFVSDGVVEARSTSGELFGFDRTLEISGAGAEAIAKAAVAFGQDDDITVLTLTLSPAVKSGAYEVAIA